MPGTMPTVHVAGGGLAGCEAALQLARFGIPSILHEMRPTTPTPAHKGDRLAEIVCSNSLKSTALNTASGVFKSELDGLGCRLLDLARGTAVPAGAALAVDRELFSAAVELALANEPLIEIRREEITSLPVAGDTPWIVATGPLSSPALLASVHQLTGDDGLSFFDAIAPTVTLDSLDLDVLYRAARYDRGEADYLNAAFDREGYEAFVAAIDAAERADAETFEKGDLFEGCMPVEEIAARGRETLAHGPMRPVGLMDPRTGQRPHAVVQLRQENAAGTLYGLVGFQTRLKWGEQKRVFRMIPGLEQAEFVRFGQLHRNSYLDTPRTLNKRFALHGAPQLRFAGQLTGVEGYVESIASGLWTAWSVAAELQGSELPDLPPTTLIGSLLCGYLFDRTSSRFTPMNVNFGLLPPLDQSPRGRRGKQLRKELFGERALDDLGSWLAEPALRGFLAAAEGQC